MTIVPIIILPGIGAIVAVSTALAAVEYEALIAYGDARKGDLHLLADVRAVDDASLLAYLEHRWRWRRSNG
jgi:hypothetical protein